MMRGSLSNTLLPTLWVHSDVLIRCTGRRLLIGPKKYELLNQDWLWGVSYFVQPVVVFVGETPNKLLNDYPYIVFPDFYACRDALRRDTRAVEMVTTNEAWVSGEIVSFSNNLKRYC